METIRVLYVNGGVMHRGGIESYMMNYYRNIDRSKVQIDFVVHGFEKGVYDDEIKSMGGQIYNVPVKSKDYFGNIEALKAIFNSNKYKIVHSHMDAMNMVVLKIAQSCGVPIRIAHSHNTQHLTQNRIKYFINEYARKNVTKYATHYFSCSEPAARWLFGNDKVDNNKVVYIKNAIDLDKYKFNAKLRNEIRNKYNLNDSFVIGHVGRFDYQKNHMFLLELFSRFLENIPNAKLFLIGDGHLRNDIEKRIVNLNIQDKVILSGVINDVHHVMNAFDVFCLPSLFEGLGIVLVEAQANGLGCVTSNVVPRESDINGKIDYVDLNAPDRIWVNSLLLRGQDNLERRTDFKRFIDRGYSIVNEAKKLQDIYLKLLGVKE